jgi:hypothetical protein
MATETVGDVRADIYNRWVAPDGLMKIQGPEEVRDPYPGATLKTAANDNGILWLAYAMWLLDRSGQFGPDDRSRFNDTAERLQVAGRPDVYDRNPHRSGDRNSLDNLIDLVS